MLDLLKYDASPERRAHLEALKVQLVPWHENRYPVTYPPRICVSIEPMPRRTRMRRVTSVLQASCGAQSLYAICLLCQRFPR